MARRHGVSHPEDSKNFGKIPLGKKPLFCLGAVKQVIEIEKLDLAYICRDITEEELSADPAVLAATMVDSRRKIPVKLLDEQYDVKHIASKIVRSCYEENSGNIWHVFIPFEGDPYYLNLIDEDQFVDAIWFESEGVIGFEILDPKGDEFDEIFSKVVSHISGFCNYSYRLQLDARDELISLVVSELEARREFIKKSAVQNAKFSTEGRLLVKNEKVPRTFETPLKKRVVKPTSTKSGQTLAKPSQRKTHFAIREADFNFINEVLWGMGLSLERCSNAVRTLDEESLRDILKAPLNLHFSAVTGEAFNNTGKTDILVNAEDGTIVYIAECKKYDGPKTVSDAITQLFKNLVWRDRMCSLIVFNTDRNISTVIDGVRKAVQEHTLFVEIITDLEECKSQYTCRMKLSKDPSITAKMMVQIFDLSSES